MIAKQDLAVKTDSKSRLLSRLENLPAEIVSLTYDRLVSLVDGNGGRKPEIVTATDILALGLTSSTMFAHCVQHITLMSSRASVGPWVDTEIACIGDYVTRLPPDFTETGLAPKITWTGRSYQRQNLPETRTWNCSARANHEEDKGVFGREVCLEVFDSKTGDPKERCDEVIIRKVRQILSSITAPAGTIGYRPVTGWILRNLTRRKFVKLLPPRTDGKKKVVVPCLVDHHLGEEKVKLNDALLMRICWTTNGYQRAVRWKNSDCWAGDRFEIVHRAQDVVSEEGWKDVTEQVASEAIDLKKVEFW